MGTAIAEDHAPLKLSCTTYLPGFTAPGASFHASFAFWFRQLLTAFPAEPLHRASPTVAFVIPPEPTVTTIATFPRNVGSLFCPNSV